MKNLIKKSMALITAIVLCAIPTVQAKELDNLSSYQELVSEETIENDGLYITVSVFETKNTATKAIPYTTVYEKTGKKTYTAKNADKIVVLDGGTIIAYDTHENLLANCEIYQDIYNSQLKREGDING